MKKKIERNKRHISLQRSNGLQFLSNKHKITIGSLAKRGKGYYDGMIPSFTNMKRLK
jgi:hypothetical protein